ASTIAVTRIPTLDIGGSPSVLNPSTPDETGRLPPNPHYRRNPPGINELVGEIRSFLPEVGVGLEPPCVFRGAQRLFRVGQAVQPDVPVGQAVQPDVPVGQASA